MEWEIGEIEALFRNWELELSEGQKKYMHFYSFRNFIFHYNNLSGKAKESVLDLLQLYISEAKAADLSFNKKESYEIAIKYLNRVADYYRVMGFRINLRISFIIYWGLLTDLLLYFAHFLPKVYNIPIPILTSLLLLYYIYLAILKKPQKLVYGLFY